MSATACSAAFLSASTSFSSSLLRPSTCTRDDDGGEDHGDNDDDDDKEEEQVCTLMSIVRMSTVSDKVSPSSSTAAARVWTVQLPAGDNTA